MERDEEKAERKNYNTEEALELVSDAYNRFQSLITASKFRGQYDRLVQNRLMYAGINNGQWPQDVVDKMLAAGYPVHTVNMVQGIVDTVVGHLVQSPIDIKLSNTRPQDKMDVNVMQTLYDIDESNGAWEPKFQQFITDGLIHSGWLQILPVEDFDVRGNVGMECIDPAHLFADPYWISNDIRDCRFVYKCTWMTAKQIKVFYDTKAPAVEQAIEAFEHYTNANPSMIRQLFDRSVEFYDTEDDKYKVVDYHYLEDCHEPVIVDTYTGEELSKEELPEETHDMELKPLQMWLNIHKPKRYTVFNRKIQKAKFVTFCPGLGLDFVLEAGDYPYQMGHLPFFRWCYHNVYGEPLGLVDLLIDVQQILNKRESQITKILNMKTAANWALESDAFGADTARIKDFERRINRTGQTFVVEPGTNSQAKIKPLFDNTPLTDLRSQTQSLMDYMQRVSNVTPAMQGQLQSKQETGVLYEQMQSQSFTVLETLVSSLKQFKKQFARAYIYSALEQYGEDPRVLYDTYSEKNIALNIMQYNPQDGQVYVSNQLHDAKWYQIAIETRRLGEGAKKQRISQYALMLNSMSSPAARAVLEHEIIRLMDLPDEALGMLNASLESQFNTAMIQTNSQGVQAQAQEVQANMLIQQAQAPQMQQNVGLNQQNSGQLQK